ncbi:MAG: hypothetical protein WC052_04565, partial [Patescibacteria group bacterium]
SSSSGSHHRAGLIIERVSSSSGSHHRAGLIIERVSSSTPDRARRLATVRHAAPVAVPADGRASLVAGVLVGVVVKADVVGARTLATAAVTATAVEAFVGFVAPHGPRDEENQHDQNRGHYTV